jgi:hypothetical protein
MSLKVGTEVSKTRAIKLVDESGNEMTSTAATSDDVLYSIIEDSTGLFAIDASKTVPDTEKANPDTIGGAV